MLPVNSDGKPSLKIYSASTSIWMTVASSYVQIEAEGIGKGFEKEDGIRISGYLTEKMDALKNILINDEGDNLYSTNTYIIDKTDNAITIPGIYRNAVDEDEDYTELELIIESKVKAYMEQNG